MKEILQIQFWDNSIQLYLEVFGVIVAAFILKKFISKYFAAVIFRLFYKKDKTAYKNAFVELIVDPLELFIFLIIILIALDKLKLPRFLDFSIYKITTKELLDAIANTAFIVVFMRLCLRFVKFVSLIFEAKANLTATQSDNQLVVFFRDFFRVILYIAGFLMILHFTFHYDISKLVTGLSIVGAAVALATKESLENLIASFIIFFDKPFTTGDLVKVQGFTGNVEKIGLRSTRIRTDHKTYITVPNKQMVDTILDNISLRSQRRAEINLEVGLSAKPADLRNIIPAIKNILQQDAIEGSTVFLSDTGRNAHIINIVYFATIDQSINEFNELREKINFSIIELLGANNLELAAASTDIIVQEKK